MIQNGINFNPEWSIRVNVEHILGDAENLERIPAKIRKAKNLRALSPEEYQLISAMTEQVKALSRNIGYDAEDALNVDPETGEIIEPLN